MPPATRRQARTRQSLEAEDDPSMEMAGEEMLDEPDIMDRPALSTDVYPDEEGMGFYEGEYEGKQTHCSPIALLFCANNHQSKKKNPACSRHPA